MRVRIHRDREVRRAPAGWFAREKIPAYCISLTIGLTEEERYLIQHAGLGRKLFILSPMPPEIVDPETIEKMREENFGEIFIRDLLGYRQKSLVGVWPDLIAADAAEAEIREKLEELSSHIKRAGGTTECNVVYDL